MMMDNEALTYLAWTGLLTALMWVPYVLNRTMVRGLMDTVGYPDKPKPLAPWAERAKAAHYNAIENLAVFAPLVLIANLMHVSNETTAMAALVYLLARVAHYIVYAFRLPWLRTLAFTAGWVCTVVVAAQILF